MIVLSTHYWNEGIVYVQHYVEIKSAIYLVWVQKPFLFFYPLAVGSFCAHQSDWDWTTIWQSITRLLSWHQPFLPWIGTIHEDSSTWVVFRHLISVLNIQNLLNDLRHIPVLSPIFYFRFYPDEIWMKWREFLKNMIEFV